MEKKQSRRNTRNLGLCIGREGITRKIFISLSNWTHMILILFTKKLLYKSSQESPEVGMAFLDPFYRGDSREAKSFMCFWARRSKQPTRDSITAESHSKALTGSSHLPSLGL